MRILHTADWHLGRRLRGQDRTDEIARLLDELLQRTVGLAVDLVVVAGDLFDGPNPSVEAQKVAYDFFLRLDRLGVPTVVVAGNHDSAAWIDALAGVLRLAGVHALGRPRRAGALRIETPGGLACVGALPFASERRLLSYADLWEGDGGRVQVYREAMARLLGDLQRGFRDDAVNLAVAHLATATARTARSEVEFYTRDAYALPEALLPAEAQYVALGHIHTPQRLAGPATACYSGSLLQVDFGEAGEQKGFFLVEVEPGGRPRLRFEPVEGPRPLRVIHCALADLEEVLESARHFEGWLKFVVTAETGVPGLAGRVRTVCPQALHVEVCLPQPAALAHDHPASERFEPERAFVDYWLHRHGCEVPTEVQAVFLALYEETTVDAPPPA